jgi:Fungal chitosanase of glycosyl hydrolase group 75
MLAIAIVGCGGGASEPPRVDGGSPAPGDGGVADAALPETADAGDPTVTDLLTLLQSCNVIGGKYATDFENSANIDVCGLHGAVFWKSDFDIDCDGKRTTVCNEQTDGAYQPRTSARASNGEFLDASQLPYAVIPLPSSRWSYEDSDIDLGTVVAVIYQGKLQYAVFGDQGPDRIIGEGSYKLAQLLGIDPDPSNGGTDGPVYFVAFTGANARVHKMEDQAEAVQIGQAKTQELLSNN